MRPKAGIVEVLRHGIGVMGVHLTGPGSDAGARCAPAVLAAAAGALFACGAAPTAMLLLFALAGDHMTFARPGIRVDLPPLVLWAWDRDDDLRFLDTSDTGVAFLAATLTLRSEGVVLTPRHNPLAVPEGVSRVAVVHVETDRAEPPALSGKMLRRFVEVLAAVSDELPHMSCRSTTRPRHLSAPFSSMRSRLCASAFPARRSRSRHSLPGVSTRAGPNGSMPMRWCRCCSAWAGRRVRAHFANGGDFRGVECRSSLGVATDELPAELPPGRRVYVFSPRRWTPETYEIVRMRIRRWSPDQLFD
jgi:hypothetical protein